MNAFNILTKEGYFGRFYQLYKTKTQKEAYEILEKELLENYGVHRYSSLQSFKNALYIHINFSFRQIQ